MLTGKWDYVDGGYRYEFHEDGTGSYTFCGAPMKFTYEVSGDVVKILFDGNTAPMETKFRIEDDMFIIKDMFDRDVKYKRVTEDASESEKTEGTAEEEAQKATEDLNKSATQAAEVLGGIFGSLIKAVTEAAGEMQEQVEKAASEMNRKFGYISRQKAYELLRKYNSDPFHIQHAFTVEAVMKWFAQNRGYADEAEYWGIVGLLHDIDFEKYPEEHCIKAPELLREGGVSEDIIHAVCSHGYGITVGNGTTIDVEPVHEMEKILFAADELTGLIWSASLMRPSKSCKDMELKSLKKKYKAAGFAAGCSREVIGRGAEQLGWELDQLLDLTLQAMAASEDAVNEQMAKEFPPEEEEGPKYLENENGYAIDPLFTETVDFETFSKSDFRVVKVKACEAVAKSKKLLHFTLDDGTGTDRTILSGIHAFYEPEELVGKTLLAITNLPPRPMMGIESCGMLLSAIHYENGEEKLHLVMLDDAIPAGAKLY